MNMLPNTFSERAGLSAEIVKVAVTSFQPQKLLSNDTSIGGAHSSTFGFFLGHGSNQQIDIVDRCVNGLETLNYLLNFIYFRLL